MENKIKKYWATPSRLKSIEGENGIELFPFIITAQKKDRHGDIIDVESMNIDNYEKYGVVLLGHNPDAVVGKTHFIKKEIIENVNAVVAYVEFNKENPLGLQTYKDVKGGFLNAASVGIMLTENPIYSKEFESELLFNTELLEWSIVSIPANANAVKIKGLDSKVFDFYEKSIIENENEINYLEKSGAEISKGNLALIKDAKEFADNIVANLSKLIEKNSEKEKEINFEETETIKSNCTSCGCGGCSEGEGEDTSKETKTLNIEKLSNLIKGRINGK
jgi:hypothetical protein